MTVEELAKHDGRDGSHWISIYGEVWDITEWYPKHPGGVILRTGSGREATTLFESYHPGYSLPKIMATLKSNGTLIGKLEGGYTKVDSTFFTTVRDRVEKALEQRKITRHLFEWLGLGEVILTLILYTIAWYYAIFSLSIFAMIALGFLSGRLGFIMHMGNHGAMSHSSFRNHLIGYCHNILGSDWLVWSMEHQVAHHTNTNELNKDNDYSIGSPYLRFNRFVEHKGLHRFNHIITFLVMPLGVWRWYFDDVRCVLNGEVGSVKFHTDKTDLAISLFWKAFWGLRCLVLPIYLWGFWKGMMPAVIAMAITAWYLENTFIVNHIQTGLEPKQGTHWAVRQVHTTCNWGSGSHWANFISGGLNHQIEHHLFPSITHYLYPVIHPIVLQTCREFGVPYYHFETYSDAFYAVYRHLQSLAFAEDDPRRPAPVLSPDLTAKAK